MHNKQFDWDDLRYILKVAESGSIGAAAQALGVNRTTVLRRINQFEKKLEYQLFDRRGSGYQLAPGAEKMLAAALDVEKTIDDLQRQILGKTIELQGNLRVTTTDAILMGTVAPHLESFRHRHPQITLEMVVSNHQLSLTQGDADVAIRPGMQVPENLVATKLGIINFGIFGGHSYLKQRASSKIEDHRWLGVVNPLLRSPPGEWISANISEKLICLKADSFVALRIAAESDMGLAVLPANLGVQSEKLEQVFAGQPGISNFLWIVTHPDLARSARVHAFTEHMVESM